MLQFLVSHILRSSVCVCCAANGGDDGFALFIQVLLACADFQFCQKRLRGCASGAGTGCNRSKASENPKNSRHAPPPCVCCAANRSDDGFALFIQVLLACADFQFCPNWLRGCVSRAGTGCNRFRVSSNPRVAFAPSPVRVRILLSRFVSFIRREHLATCRGGGSDGGSNGGGGGGGGGGQNAVAWIGAAAAVAASSALTARLAARALTNELIQKGLIKAGDYESAMYTILQQLLT